MKIYMVVYNDENDIRHILTDAIKAEKCKEYELKELELYYKFENNYDDGYDRYTDCCGKIKIIERECSDELDFDVLISNLEKIEKEKQQVLDDKIKAKDLAEFNRIKEKYKL